MNLTADEKEIIRRNADRLRAEHQQYFNAKAQRRDAAREAYVAAHRAPAEQSGRLAMATKGNR